MIERLLVARDVRREGAGVEHVAERGVTVLMWYQGVREMRKVMVRMRVLSMR